MRFRDHMELSLSNLWKVKLRTLLTTAGVVVGIGAFTAMISFGLGMQKNVAEAFRSLDLLNTVIVFPPGGGPGARPDGRDPAAGGESGAGRERGEPAGQAAAVLDDRALEAIAALPGVETAYPDVSFPALVRLNGREEFRLVQVLPARIAGSKAVRIRTGRPYASDEAAEIIVDGFFLRGVGVKDPASILGARLELVSVSFDPSLLAPAGIVSFLQGGALPLNRETYAFTVVGVSESGAFGPEGVLKELMIPPGAAGKIKSLPFRSIWDVFRLQEGRAGYSALNVRLSSPADAESVKTRIRDMGFSTFALADQFAQIRRGFLFLDMVLAAIGMIAVFVAALGIINTMIMSILERTREIGIMKAVGAGDGDVRSVFVFEASVIGFLGGLFGYGLGWAVSRAINRVVNYFLARQGVPAIDYFAFPWWLFLGALAFAVAVSLAAGLYPARRAARVDPVQALRHD
ncbi:MAG: ABC transporter permease [Candidatus Aminicenantes bacterium]|nr:ABC transporter permease [Candidatus Aminicenantes bacterium]